MTYVNVQMANGDTVELSTLAPRSVALDGMVQGPVMGDEEDRWSFDHHAGCARLVTQATCEQVWTATRLGFKWAGRDVWINDLDGDTVLSLYVIHTAVNGVIPPADLGSLVRAVGLMDAHGPAAIVLMTPEERALADTFYHGVIYPTLGRNVQERFGEWRELLEECHDGIDRLLSGELERAQPKPEPVEMILEKQVGSLKLAVAECPGFGGFVKLYGGGYDVVILTTEAAGGTRRYTLGKVSDLVPFNLSALLGRLNELEDGWGGSSSIGGSPRKEGGESSLLLPELVFFTACKVAEEGK